MTTAVGQLPADLQVGGLPRSRRAPARRAIVRWAWRLFRREWRQQVLVLALLTLAIGATVTGSAVATNSLAPVDGTLGTAHYRIMIPASDRNLAADIDRAKQTFGAVEVTAHRS